ncbi:transcription antitermination factor NusB [Patescibacteria group bacterium]|nr:transcription antitermination factor NusB [Patescibacteria group bacterium]MBU1472419.1 transcription antitermination factor NusB [Patescibacteria group bacterium]MBU2460234.1 transcription antitermination factor NusB [Patescibacteria group bacterium]MBU2544561.1 transcription antitermination factor NusB [Patescibacteria group bacterium]
MKTSQDPRHQRRIKLMEQLFTLGFGQNSRSKAIGAIRPHLSDIDRRIQEAAPEWPIEKIAKIDLAVLRLALYELTATRKEPPKVIVDEAVELAKEFGNDNSPKFINGVLGTILKKEGIQC